MPRRLRYQVASSLDGFIAGPNGEYDWIVMDPAIDFNALYKEFDTALMGRKTYEVGVKAGYAGVPGLEAIVFSRTLPAATQPGVRIVNDDPVDTVRALKKTPGRDIWLFGGGTLFRTLLDAGLVDSVELAVMPVLIGAGIPVLPPGGISKLVLSHQKTLPSSGIVVLSYSVPGGTAAPPIRYVRGRRTKKSTPRPKGKARAAAKVKGRKPGKPTARRS